MEIKHCFRCGSTEVHKGVLSEDRPVETPVLWKSQSRAILDDVLINAVLCKLCGHIELVADSNIIGIKVKQKCPYCKAIYSYHKKSITEGEVVCQNCEKHFPIKDSEESTDIIDAIEENLREE